MASLAITTKACYAQAETIGKATPSGYIKLPECPFCFAKGKAGLTRIDGKHRFNCFVCCKKVQSPDEWDELAARMAAPMQYQATATPKQATVKREYPWQNDPMKWHSRYTNNTQAVIAAWQAYKPLSEAMILRCQLGLGRMPHTSCEHPRLIYANIENRDKQATAFRGRVRGCGCDPKWLTIAGSNAWLWGGYHILKMVEGKDLIIGENPIDGILAMQELKKYSVAGTAGAGTFPMEWCKMIAAARPKRVLVWYDNDLIGNPTPYTKELLVAEWIEKMRSRGVEPSAQQIEQQRTKAMAPKIVSWLRGLHIPTFAYTWAEGTTPRMDMGEYIIRSRA